MQLFSVVVELPVCIERNSLQTIEAQFDCV